MTATYPSPDPVPSHSESGAIVVPCQDLMDIGPVGVLLAKVALLFFLLWVAKGWVGCILAIDSIRAS